MTDLVNPEDFEISSYPDHYTGGQHVGSGPRGVKIVHIPSGLTAICDRHMSQFKNRIIAMDMIVSGLTHPKF